MLNNILVHEQYNAAPCTMFNGRNAKYAKHLSTFGEIRVTADCYFTSIKMTIDK